MPPNPQQAMMHALQLHQAGRLQEAVALYRQALAWAPNNASVYSNLGAALRDLGQADEAIVACRKAIALNPNMAEAYINLGAVWGGLHEYAEAAAAFRKAVALRPEFPENYVNLGAALRNLGQADEAVAACRKAIELKPDFVQAHNNLGNALRDKGLGDEAISAYRKAIEIRPDYFEGYGNLGAALQDKGVLDEALAACDKALQIKGDFADAHWNKAVVLFLKGDLAQGWAEYEWRWQSRNFLPPRRGFRQPQWKGADPRGQTVLLHAEQGFGDTVQFIRYAPLAAARGARVVVECQPELKRLLEGMEGVQRLVGRGEPLPPFHMHVPMLSLPLAFGTTLQTVPANVPYLRPAPALVDQWHGRLASRPTLDAPRLKIGLAWAGSPTHKNDRNRTVPLEILAPLAGVKGVELYSLQKGEAARQAKDPPAGMTLADLTEDLGDFADTAALIANLDLVIAVDTVVVHLAGAMAKPVWALLPFMPDWRWMLDREDSPWYPTMRLFRQKTRGDWAGVIERVVEEMKERVQ